MNGPLLEFPVTSGWCERAAIATMRSAGARANARSTVCWNMDRVPVNAQYCFGRWRPSHLRTSGRTRSPSPPANTTTALRRGTCAHVRAHQVVRRASDRRPTSGRISGWRRMPHGVSLPLDAAYLRRASPGRLASDRRDHEPDALRPRCVPVGPLSSQPRRVEQTIAWHRASPRTTA